MFSIKSMELDHQQNPIGLESSPKISWCMESDKQNIVQTKYQIQLSKEESFEEVLYDSFYIDSEQSINVKLPDVVCEAFTYYFIRVRVKNNIEEETGWCVSYFSTGYVDKSIAADMITIEASKNLDNGETYYLRKEFDAEKKIESAYCMGTALGLYYLYINGDRIGDYKLTPGWTSYEKNLLYQFYDVTGKVIEGQNTIGAIVGSGWYKGSIGFERVSNFYGDESAFLCELHIKYTDGTSKVVVSDDTWRGHMSPVVSANIYDGETYDARKEVLGWCEAGLDAKDWLNVKKVEFDKSILRLQICEPVGVIDKIPPKSLFETPAGQVVIDFGQNMSGLVEMSLKGKKGDVVEVVYFEVLDKDGNVYLDNLRGAKQTIKYIFGEKEEVVYMPSFTFQGFQYAWIKQFPNEIKTSDFNALVVSSAMERTGYIETSNKDVNQLAHNILWGLNSNFVDIPTDCPQRDERMGWTGDAQIFCRTACYLKNCYNFYKKYLVDLAHDQTDEGGVPHVVPDLLSGTCGDNPIVSQGTDSATGWADAAVIMPWTLYQVYGDKDILISQYSSMKAWIDFMRNHSEDYIWSYKLQFGDWVALDAEEGSYFGATPNELLCAAYCAYSTKLFINIARVLGRQKDVVFYSNYYDKVVEKYHREFFDENGRITAQTQTAQIVSLYFDLVPNENKQIVVDDLVKLLEKENGHLVTGFLGTPYFCSALSQNGKVKEAYDLFLKDDFPSWLYQVKMGATTIWEHWDGVKPDGSMWSPDMNSFNHYAYGAIGEWMQRSMIGIELDEQNPGYKHYYIQPLVDDRFSFAEGKLITQYGEIKNRWEINDGLVKLTVNVPVNTHCTILLKQAKKVLDWNGESTFIDKEEGYTTCVGSGEYQAVFEV